MPDDRLAMTAEQYAAMIGALDIPQALRHHLAGNSAPDGFVHWRGLAEQEVLTPLGIHTPSRCGRFAHDTMGYPLRYVTCPQCCKLAEEPGAGVDDGFIMLERAGGGAIRRDGDQITITPTAEVGNA